MRFKLFDSCSDIRYLVTEKDMGHGCSFSMALHTGEDKKEIERNRATVAGFFGREYGFCGIKQVHGDEVLVLDSREEKGWSTLEDAVEADAVVTDLPRMVLTILTADCVPILLYDPVRQAVGAVHAGWKGTKSEIVKKTVERMKQNFGSRAEDIMVAIGPSIGKCCYEVDISVAEHFTEYGDSLEPGAAGERYQLDLKSVNRKQLTSIGVPSQNIEVSSICTACSSDRYFSYRKDGCSGRFLSAIAVS